MSDDKKSDDYRVDMPSSRSSRAPSPVMRSQQKSAASLTENPVAAILSYCGSSILMTVTNKYVLSGVDFNLNFFLLCVQVRNTMRLWEARAYNVQSVVCVSAISMCKAAGIITYRDFNSDEAKKCMSYHIERR
jgi:GDP-mannose transporter